MSLTVSGLLGPQTISTSETETINFVGVGTLNIIGPAGAPPIDVTLSQTASIGALATFNIVNANVKMTGLAGVSLLTTYNIGTNGTLDFTGVTGIGVGTNIAFTGTTGRFVINTLLAPTLLNGFSGFGPGKSIDIVSASVSRIAYADATGANTGGSLTVYGQNGAVLSTIPLTTGDFIPGNFGIIPDGRGGSIIEFESAVTSVTASPANATLGPNATVNFTVAMTNPVALTGGTPSLTLDDGGTATYNAALSTSTSLVFTYVVGPTGSGQNSADLNITATNLNTTTATVGGGGVNIVGVVGNPLGTLVIDTTAPTVASLTVDRPNASIGAGGTVTFSVALTEGVTVTNGNPTLLLNSGGNAIYASTNSTASILRFNYTVQPGENAADLAVSGFNLNNARAVDAAGNALDLTLAVTNPTGILVVDTTPPTVTGVTTTSSSGALSAGQTVNVNVALSEAVTLAGGTPTLTLNDGGTATYDTALSTPTKLVFTHTVQPGNNAADLAITAITLNGATIADPAGNVLNLATAIGNPPGILVVDTTPPTVTGVTTTSSSGILSANQIVSFNVALSEAVNPLNGTPTLTLNDGGTATYDAARSTPTNLVFTHTIQPGNNAADLAITAITLNNATIADPAGNVLNLAAAIGNPPGILIVDTVAPTVTGVTTTPGSGTFAAGQAVSFSVALSEAALVNGIPTLTLNDGGTATYDAANSTPTNLRFTHIIQPGQNSTDLAVTGLTFNNAAITDLAGNALDIAGALVNPAGILIVDTTAPTVGAVTTSPGSGILGVGQTVNVNVALSEATIVNGTPTLTLSDGGTATYDSINSTPTNLVFNHTVQAGQNAADLAVTAIALNGATIADAVGNVVNLAAAIGNPTGILVVDTTAPTITGVTTTPGTGALAAGQIVSLNVALSEATIVNGTPTLTLNDGGTATYDAARSTPTNLAFTYTVQPGDNAADLAVSAITLNGATITDPAGNVLNLAAAIGNPPGTLVIDTQAPTIGTVTTSPGTGTLVVGQTVSFSVPTSEPVILTGGVPTLTLSDGGTATYDATRSTPTNLVFTHLVRPGQNAADLAITSVSLNGATIADPAGNAFDLTSAIGNPAGILIVDSSLPAVASVTPTAPSAYLAAQQTVTFDLGLTAAVQVTGGTPFLNLNDGGTATYDAANSTPTNLRFTYVVQSGQNTADLTITSVDRNGAVLSDSGGHILDFTGATIHPAGILVVDTQAPTLASVSATPGTGTLSAGQTLTFSLNPSEAVTLVNGTPTLTLNDGGTATYDATRSTSTNLLFTYTVRPGDNAANLAISGANLNSATIADLAGNALDLNSSVGRPLGTLAVDTKAPTITGVTTTPGTGALAANQTVAFNVALSEAVTLVNGIPTLTLNDGGTATYDPTRSTPTNLVFTHTIQPGQNAADLAVTAVTLNGTTIADPGGNVLDLAAAIVNPAGTLAVDTTAPTITGVTTSPGSGTLAAGQTVSLNVAISEATIVSGTPTLTLSDGGTATYDAAGSTPTNLVFIHTVQPGQNAADLAITGAVMAGATIADVAGNLLDLATATTGTNANPPGVLAVDTASAPTPPSIRTVTTTPGDGVVGPGQIVSFIVTTDAPAFVTGGTPTLALNDGGTATYNAARSTPTSLVFDTTILPGQLSDDLAVTGYALNGASITGANGAAMSLDPVRVNPPGILQVAANATPTDPTNPINTGSNTLTPPSDPTIGTIPIYRFFDSKNGTHFYTPSADERQTILQTRPDLIPEGPGGVGLRAIDPASKDPNAVEVFRFFDKNNGTQFLTASTTERDGLIAGRPDLVFEPAGSFFEHTQPQPNDTAVYRFFSSTDGTHFYTDNAAERLTILQTRPDLIAEGIGFYEPT